MSRWTRKKRGSRALEIRLATGSFPYRRRLWFETLEDRRLLSAAPGSEALQLFSTSTALFVENQGQWHDDTVRYGFNGPGVNIAFTDEGLKFLLTQREQTQDSIAVNDGDPLAPVLDPLHAERFNPEQSTATQTAQFSVSFDGANAVAPTGLDEAETRFNYFVGDQPNWHANVPGFATVAYNNLYNGIDLQTFGRRDSLKYEFHVAPGADWRQIEVSYNGVQGLSIDDVGALHVQTALGELVDDAPYIYQIVNGEQVEVAGSFRLVDAHTYAFEVVGLYDPGVQLVIDPDLAWATYLGGSGDDYGYGVALDGSGAALVAGYTSSTDFAGPTNSNHGGLDVFVAKLSSSGTLAWATYLGGSNDDRGSGVAVDASGAASVAGHTFSTDFAGRTNSYHGSEDAFVAKVSSSGTLAWATYLGGSSGDYGYGVAVDASGAALVAGGTSSTDFAGRTNSKHGGSDAFVAKLSSSGTLAWETYLGGSSGDSGFGVAVDTSGSALVAGYTISNDFAGQTNSNHGGPDDAFVAKVSSSGTLAWATYLGGSLNDFGYGVAVDASGAALVVGNTGSTDFAGQTNSNHGGSNDAFVAKVSSSGTLAWATYLGGSGVETGLGVAVEASGAALVPGFTSSTDFAGRTNSYHGGSYDAFVAKMSSSGTLAWAAYLGGSGDDYGYRVALDASGAALVVGATNSTDFAGRTNSSHGSYDAFVARIPLAPLVTSATASPSTSPQGGPLTINWSASDDVEVDHIGLYLWAGGAAINTSVYGGTSDGALGTAALNLSNSGSYTWTIPAGLAVRSDYTVKVVAWDAAGNAGYLFTNTFSVIAPDTTAPTFSNPKLGGYSPSSTFQVTQGNILYFAGSADDDVGLSIITVNVTSPRITNYTVTTGPVSGTSVPLFSYIIDTGNSSYANVPGQYIVTIFAKDTSNNVSSQTWNFTVGFSEITGQITDGHDTFNVSIQNYDVQNWVILPNVTTWIVTHGRNGSRNDANIRAVAAAIRYQQPHDQVLTLDWSEAAYDPWLPLPTTHEDWIPIVAQWAASALVSHGFLGSNLNLVGHSWGSYVSEEIAKIIAGGVNTIVGLDPAENGLGNWSPDDPDEIDFNRDSKFSWAFYSEAPEGIPGLVAGNYGNETTPTTANEAIVVRNSSHAGVVSLFASMLENPNDTVAQWFRLDRLLQAAPGPWLPDQYDYLGYIHPHSKYEAVITADANGTSPVSIDYIAINHAPGIIGLPDRILNEDSTVNNDLDLWAYAGDAETPDSGLTFTIVGNTNPQVGVRIDSNRYIDISPSANWYGFSDVTIQVSDGALTDTDTFRITVNPVNDSPTITGLPDSAMDEDFIWNNAIDLWAYASDLETSVSNLTYSIVGNTNPQVGVSIDANRYVDVNPSANWFGFSDVTIQVSDGALTDTDTLRITVNSVNDAPAISGLPDRTMDEDYTWTSAIDLWAYSSDIETSDSGLAFSIVGNTNSQVGVSIFANRYIDINPSANWFGISDVTIQISDGSLTDTDSFRITVNSVNDAPTIGGLPDRTMDEDYTWTSAIDLWTYAPDPETADSGLTFSIVGNTNSQAGVSIFANRYVDINPSANWFGISDVTIQVSDGSLTDTDSFRITVNSVNDAPTIGSLSDSPDPVAQPSLLTLTTTASDIDGQVVRVEFYRDSNGNGALDLASDQFLGADTSSSGGWTWSGSTGALPVGTNRYFARAQDNDGDWSGTSTTTSTVQPALLGDYNQNHSVDAADYVLWRKTVNTTGITPYTGADGSGNGNVGQEDYGVWRANFAQTVGVGSEEQGGGSQTAASGLAEPAAIDARVEGGVGSSEVARSEEPGAGGGTAAKPLVEKGELGGQPSALPGVHNALRLSYAALAREWRFAAHGHVHALPPAEPGAVGVMRDDGLIAWLGSRGDGRKADGGETDGVIDGEDCLSYESAMDGAIDALDAEVFTLV